LAVDDVTRDPRFAADVAARTGYVPRSLLVTPIGHQAWGLTPFEGIAAGVPSVVSDEAGASEILAARDRRA